MKIPTRTPRRQKGSVIVFAALGMSLLVILLSVSDIGFLYFYKREYQKAADLAAIAGAKTLINSAGVRSCSNATGGAQVNATQNLGSKTYTLGVICGKWNASAATAALRFNAAVTNSELNAVKATISGTPPRFLPFIAATTISASATALADQPVAQLTLRNTVAAVDTQKSAVLNAVVGGLLGGSINLPVASWNGLLNTNINLLSYLDALAIRLGISAGNYDQVLAAPVSVGNLLNAAADVLPAGSGPDVSASLNSLAQLGLGLPQVTVGQLLGVQTNLPTSALDVGLNVLQLVEGSVQLAGRNNVVSVGLPVTVPGLVNASVRVKVIEPGQLSKLGNPALAAANPTGPDAIAVRTSQVRALASLDLSGLGTQVTNIANAVTAQLSSVTTLLNQVLALDLANAVGNILGSIACPVIILAPQCPSKQVIYTEALSNRIDVSLDAGAANAYVNNYSCSADGQTKSLSAPTQSSLAELRIGNLGTSSGNPNGTAFSSSTVPTAAAVELIRISYVTFRPNSCLLGLLCSSSGTYEPATGSTWVSNIASAKKTTLASITLQTNPVAPSRAQQTTVFSAPPASSLPEIGAAPYFAPPLSSAGVVTDLSNTLGAVSLQIRSSSGAGVLGSILTDTNGLLNSLLGSLRGIIGGVLSPLLDPLLNQVLNTLGISVNQVELGANLSCDGGDATLVD